MHKIIPSKLLAVWCLFPILGCQLVPTSAKAATPVKFTLVRNYLIVTLVTVPGVGTFEFLLDTGSTSTLLQTEFAQQIGLRPIDNIELITVAGSKIIPRSQLPQLTFAGKVVSNLEVLFSNLDEIRAVMPNVRGVLGQNFLSQCNYLVDYARRQILLQDEPDTRWCGEQFPFTMHEGKILVTVHPMGKLALDSAIADLLLFDGAEQKPRLNFSQEAYQSFQLRSDVGRQDVWQGKLRFFQLGSLAFQNLPVTLLQQRAADAGRKEVGLLPMSIFPSIYVNHHHRYLILNPIPDPHPPKR